MTIKKSALFLILCALFLFPIARTWSFEDKISIKHSYYFDNRSIYFDNTEGIAVHSPTLYLSKKITDNIALHAKGSMDAISSASRKIDAVTTASPKAEMERRVEENVGLSYLHGRFTTFDLGLGYSGEEDYNSAYGYLSVAHEMFNKNTTLGGVYSHNSDRIYTTKPGDTRQFPRGRETDSYGFSLSQILSRTTLAAIGYNYMSVRGYMGSTQNIVRLSDGTYAEENHPGYRNRNAFVFRINQYIIPTRSAVHFSYRYYTDDWSVDSHDMGVKLYQYLNDELVLRLKYRYYDQSQSFFWAENPIPGQEYNTWDGRMKNIHAHLYGVKFIYDLAKVTAGTALEDIFTDTEANFVMDRYYQDTGFNYYMVQAGLTLKF